MVLARPEVEGLYFLNQTAAFIWADYRAGLTPERMASHLSDCFDISGPVALRDVGAAVGEWQRLLGAGAQGSRYGVLGKQFQLQIDSAELAAEVLPRVAHLRLAQPEATAASDEVSDFSLRRGEAETVSAARALLLQEMVRLARGSEWLALIHGGACATESGCVVFAGAAGAGKSTLAAVMEGSRISRGLMCHGDDSVGIEKGSLLVPPMPFGVAVREGSWGVVGARREGFEGLEAVERFGQRVRFVAPGEQAGAVRAVGLVFPRYEADGAFVVEEIGVLEALLGLKEAGFWVEHTRESITAFLGWVLGVRRYRMVYSDVDDAVRFFGDLLSV